MLLKPRMAENLLISFVYHISIQTTDETDNLGEGVHGHHRRDRLVPEDLHANGNNRPLQQCVIMIRIYLTNWRELQMHGESITV